jgi:hypothetical protein
MDWNHYPYDLYEHTKELMYQMDYVEAKKNLDFMKQLLNDLLQMLPDPENSLHVKCFRIYIKDIEDMFQKHNVDINNLI